MTKLCFQYFFCKQQCGVVKLTTASMSVGDVREEIGYACRYISSEAVPVALVYKRQAKWYDQTTSALDYHYSNFFSGNKSLAPTQIQQGEQHFSYNTFLTGQRVRLFGCMSLQPLLPQHLQK